MEDGYEEVSLEHRTQLKNLYVDLAEDVVELLYQRRVINADVMTSASESFTLMKLASFTCKNLPQPTTCRRLSARQMRIWMPSKLLSRKSWRPVMHVSITI